MDYRRIYNWHALQDYIKAMIKARPQVGVIVDGIPVVFEPYLATSGAIDPREDDRPFSRELMALMLVYPSHKIVAYEN